MPKERYPQPNKEQATKHFACLEYSQGLYDIPAAASHGLALAKLILIMWSTEPEKKPQHSGRTLAHDQMTQSKCRLLHLLSVFLCLLPHYFFFWSVLSVQFSPVQSLCRVWLCNPMDCSSPGLPVHHQLPELTQTHVHRVGDAIQPYDPLLSPSPPTFSLSQHQGLFQWVSSSHLVAKVLKFRLQHQSFQWIFRTDFL